MNMTHIRGEALAEALKICGGQHGMARALGIRQQAIFQWKQRGYVPAGRVLAIEEVTEGLVNRHRLRPDIFGLETEKAGETNH